MILINILRSSAAVGCALATFDSDRDIKDVYHNIPAVSVDYSLMEKSDHVAVVRLDNKWGDLGNFDAMYAEFDKDELQCGL